jgi:Leucine-rich repeat (LRR) protein
MPTFKLIDSIENDDQEVVSADFSYRKITPTDKIRLIKALKKNTHVTELNLTSTNFTITEIISIIEACPQLKSLIILHLKLDDSVAIALSQHCRALESLDALDNRFSGIGVTALSKLPNLTTLNLGLNPDISYDDMSTISIFPKLRCLYLCNVNIGDLGAERISRSKTLNELYLGENNITEKGALFLSQMININILDLYGNKVGNVGATAFDNHPALHTLTLSRNGVGDLGAIALSKNGRLRNLDLSDNEVGDDGAMSFRSSTLELLNLNNNKIRYRGAGALDENKVTDISLDENNIGSSWKEKFNRRMLGIDDDTSQQATKRQRNS